MSPSQIRAAIVAERVAWIRQMVQGVLALPLSSYESFSADSRTPAAAESYLRRGLEALLDLGRHVLAKGFARAPSQYREIADQLVQTGVLTDEAGSLLRQMAGYGNRMVHFYQEISQEELYLICTQQLEDVDRVCVAILDWLRQHPERVDTTI